MSSTNDFYIATGSQPYQNSHDVATQTTLHTQSESLPPATPQADLCNYQRRRNRGLPFTLLVIAVVMLVLFVVIVVTPTAISANQASNAASAELSEVEDEVEDEVEEAVLRALLELVSIQMKETLGPY